MDSQNLQSEQKYYLIFKDNKNNAVIIERATITEVYDLVTEHSMPQGTYRIIKGEKIL